MQVRCCGFPESFGKGILQREGLMVPGYMAPGGENFRPVCERDQTVVARGLEFSFLASNYFS